MNSEMKTTASPVRIVADHAASFARWFLGGSWLLCAVAACAAVSSRAEAKSIERPETCYLFSYFYHQTAGDGLHLAWSRDGFAWEILGADESYLHPAVG